MNRMGKILVSLVAPLYISAIGHPIHVSVCEMEFNEERHAIEVTQRVFLDDLENDLRRVERDETIIVKGLSTPVLDELLGNYTQKFVSIHINGREKAITFVGHETDRDVMFIYFEVSSVDGIEHLDVRNEIMLGLFDDQVNLVHVNNGREIKSLRIDNKQRRGEIRF